MRNEIAKILTLHIQEVKYRFRYALDIVLDILENKELT